MGIAFSLSILFLQNDGARQINAVVCQNASRSFLISCLAMDAIVVVLCVALKWIWNRKLVDYRTSLIVPLVIAFVVSSALVAWNPLKDETFLNCVESGQFARYVTMANVAAIPRGLVLGGLISVVLYFLVVFIVGLISKRKKP